jgi:FkbM family methyltransferase
MGGIQFGMGQGFISRIRVAKLLCGPVIPVPEPFHLLEQNTRWAGGRIQCRNVGLSNQDARLPMFRGAVDSVTNSVHPNAETSRESFEIEVRDAGSALVEAGITRIDILKVDTEGCEVVIFESLKGFLPEVMVIYLEYHSEEDRLTLDQLLSPTHLLAKGAINGLHRGELCYVSRKWVETMPVTGMIGV